MKIILSTIFICFIGTVGFTDEWKSGFSRGLETQMLQTETDSILLVCDPEKVFGADETKLIVKFNGLFASGEFIFIQNEIPTSKNTKKVTVNFVNGIALKTDTKEWANILKVFRTEKNFSFINADYKSIFKPVNSVALNC